MIVHSTVAGFQSARSVTEGSTFIQQLCKTMRNEAQRHPHHQIPHFADIIKQTKFKLSNEKKIDSFSGLQIAEVTDTLRHDFYLELKGTMQHLLQ